MEVAILRPIEMNLYVILILHVSYEWDWYQYSCNMYLCLTSADIAAIWLAWKSSIRIICMFQCLEQKFCFSTFFFGIKRNKTLTTLGSKCLLCISTQKWFKSNHWPFLNPSLAQGQRYTGPQNNFEEFVLRYKFLYHFFEAQTVHKKSKKMSNKEKLF